MKYTVTIHTSDGSDFTFGDQASVPTLPDHEFSLVDEDGITVTFNPRHVVAIESEGEDDEETPSGIIKREFQDKPWWRKIFS